VEDVDISDDINLFQAGLIFGLGTEYYIDKSTAISGSLVFRNGFTDLLGAENEAYVPAVKEKATPFTVQLCIGVIVILSRIPIKYRMLFTGLKRSTLT